MADFVKSSCVLSIPHPGGGTSQINGYMVCWSGLKFTIATEAGPKVLNMKSYHQKSVDTSYMILTTADTDGSKATEDTTASTRNLAADEYRVCVTHVGYVGTNETIMADQQLFFPYEKIQQWGGLRWYLKGASNTGRTVQVTFDGIKVPTITDIELHVTETSNGSMVFGGVKIDTTNGLMSLKVPQKLSMLVKRENGTLWTLGGGDVASNVVTTDGEQAIIAQKTFTTVPKVSAEPSSKDDVATVGFIKDMVFGKGPFKTDLSLICEPTNASNWVVVSNAEIYLEDGNKLKCIYLENTAPTAATKPVQCVFKIIPASEAINAQPQRQDPTFFESYSLKEGELKGTVTYGHLLNSEWNEYSTYYAPFYNAQYGCNGATAESPLMHVSIDEVPCAVSMLKITPISSYLPKSMKASLSCGGMSAVSNVIQSPTSQAYELTFNTSTGGGFVTLDTEQTITGVKHFDVPPKITALAVDKEDAISLAYLHSVIGVKGPFDVSIVFNCPRCGYGNYSSFAGFKLPKFIVESGQQVQCLYADKTTPSQATAPVKAVFKLVPAGTEWKKAEEKAPDFFTSYSLKAGEFWGEVTYAHLLDAGWSENDTYYLNPFLCETNNWGYGASRSDNEQKPIMRFAFKGMSALITKFIVFNADSSPTKSQATMTIGAITKSVDCDKQLSNSGTEFVFSSLGWMNFVTLDSAQMIVGEKTFATLPKSSAEPADGTDLATKKYVDEKVAAGGGGGAAGTPPANMVTTDTKQTISGAKHFTTLPTSSEIPSKGGDFVNLKHMQRTCVTVTEDQTVAGVKTFSSLPKSTAEPAEDTELVTKKYVDEKVAAGGGSSKVGNTTVSLYVEGVSAYDTGIMKPKFTTADGKIVGVIYADKTEVRTATKPLRYVFKLINESETLQSEEKEASFFDSYQLKEGEYFAYVTPAHLCSANWDDTNGNNYHGPFGSYISKPKISPVGLWKFLEYTFEALPVEIVKFDYAIWYDLNKFQLKASTPTKFFVSKVYSKAEDSLQQNGEYSIPFDFTTTNFVTVESDQVITGEKIFDVLPKSALIPTEPTQFVTKAYVDPVQGYTITIFGKTGATNKQLGFSKVRMYFANGARLYPKFIASDYTLPSNKPVPYIWTLDYSNPNYPDPSAGSMASREMDKYKLTADEYRGFISTPNLLGKFTIANDRYFALGGAFHVYGDTTEEQGVVCFQVDGNLPPISKIELVTDNNANFQGTSIRAEVCRIGDKPKTSQSIPITGVDQQITLTFEDAFSPDPYYVNRFDNQEIRGIKTFKSVPTVVKPKEQFGYGVTTQPALFADLSGSIAQPKAKEQIITIGITSHQEKIYNHGAWAGYTYEIDVKVGGMTLKIRRPDTLVEEELFLKAVCSSKSIGYIGILTNRKPDNYPNAVETMDADAFERYSLRDGEYIAKCYYSTTSSGDFSESSIESMRRSGSAKILDLFKPNNGTSWYKYKTSVIRDGALGNGPSVIVQLAVFNAPLISTWSAHNSSTDRGTDSLAICGESASRIYQSGTHLTANWARDVPDVQLQTVNVLGVVVDLKKKLSDLETKNAALEEKVKKLEAAAPQP